MNKQMVQLQQKKKKALKALQGKDFVKAKKLLQQVCKKAPRDGQAWFLLSAANGESGDFEGVIQCCNRVLALDSRNVQALSNLGNAYASLGRHKEAILAYEKALAIAPKNPAVLHNLGNALLLEGEVEKAIRKFEETIKYQSNYAEAHYCLAGALEAEQEFDKAITHYRMAVQLNPQLLEAHVTLGQLLGRRGSLDAAEACYKYALTIHPDAEQLYYGLALAFQYQGRFDDALAAYGKVLEKQPDDPTAIAGEAEVYERKGESDEAYQRVRMLIESEKINGMAADVYLRLCRKYDECKEAINLARGLLDAGQLKTGEASQLHNALGKLYDKLGRYDEAFVYFEQANRLANVTYDAAKQAEKVDVLISAFSQGVMAKLPRASNRSEKPILIVGMPRSGTTLTEQILSSHPQVFGAGELNDLNDLINPLPETLYPRFIKNVGQQTLDELAGKYLACLDGFSREHKHVTDKMPGNFMHLGLIALMLPRCHVIHCIRDPLDTCLSIYFQRFNLTHTYATDLSDLGHYYREYERLMAHWKSVLDIPILDVHYADVIHDQEKTSREMIEFCGLEWDDRCLQFYKTDRDVATASYDQVRKPVYTSSLNRWKNYEKYLDPLREALGV